MKNLVLFLSKCVFFCFLFLTGNFTHQYNQLIAILSVLCSEYSCNFEYACIRNIHVFIYVYMIINTFVYLLLSVH